jgi:hypothetical protein
LVAGCGGGSATRAAAARQLANTSDLFGLLLAYTELAGCHTMVVGTLAPARIERTLAAPCRKLQRAAALFTRANTHSDPEALLQAAREAGSAESQLQLRWR